MFLILYWYHHVDVIDIRDDDGYTTDFIWRIRSCFTRKVDGSKFNNLPIDNIIFEINRHITLSSPLMPYGIIYTKLINSI